jgi:hypothetical protein
MHQDKVSSNCFFKLNSRKLFKDEPIRQASSCRS